MNTIITFRPPRAGTAPTSPPTGRPVPVDDEIAEGLSDTHLRLLDAAFHNAGLIASEDPSPPDPSEQADIDALTAFVDELKRRR